MPVTVHFPSMLHDIAGAAAVVHEPVADVAALLLALERQLPGIGQRLSDPIFNIAVNDEMLLHGVSHHPLKDGDVIEVVPTIAGG
jgi:molybdopterin converting factor small subunit